MDISYMNQICITNKLFKRIFCTLKCVEPFNGSYLRTFSKLNRSEPKANIFTLKCVYTFWAPL
jgi:hypothetical protein